MRYLLHLWICLLGVGLMHSPAFGDPYEKGLESYKDGDYSKSYKLLEKSSKKTKDKFDKASMLVLMGASAVKMGKNSKAKSLFGKARKLDPDVQLPSVALRDRKVKKVFNAAQRSDDEGSDFASGDDAAFGADEGSGAFGKPKKGRGKDRDRDGDTPKISSKKKGDEPKRKVSQLSYFYPFGLNEYVQEKMVPAVILGSTQVLSAYVIYKSNAEIAEANAAADSAVAAAKELNVLNDPQLLKFLNENEKYVKERQQFQTLALLGLVGSYGLSVADAAFGFFGTPPKNARASADKPLTMDYDTEVAAEDRLIKNAGWHYDFGLLPRIDPVIYFAVKAAF